MGHLQLQERFNYIYAFVTYSIFQYVREHVKLTRKAVLISELTQSTFGKFFFLLETKTRNLLWTYQHFLHARAFYNLCLFVIIDECSICMVSFGFISLIQFVLINHQLVTPKMLEFMRNLREVPDFCYLSLWHFKESNPEIVLLYVLGSYEND